MAGTINNRGTGLGANGSVTGRPKGVQSGQVESGPSRVRISVTDESCGEKREILLDGGVLGVAQDDSGRLKPVCAWMVRPTTSDIVSVAERIRAEHRWTPPRVYDDPLDRFLMGPCDFGGLYHEIEEATLFPSARPWTIRAPNEHEEISFTMSSGGQAAATRFMDLPDGTFIALVDAGDRGFIYVRAHARALDPAASAPPEGVSVLPGRLAEILSAVLDSSGSLDLPSIGALEDVFRASSAAR